MGRQARQSVLVNGAESGGRQISAAPERTSSLSHLQGTRDPELGRHDEKNPYPTGQ
jgi:hypothetical protein